MDQRGRGLCQGRRQRRLPHDGAGGRQGPQFARGRQGASSREPAKVRWRSRRGSSGRRVPARHGRDRAGRRRVPGRHSRQHVERALGTEGRSEPEAGALGPAPLWQVEDTLKSRVKKETILGPRSLGITDMDEPAPQTANVVERRRSRPRWWLLPQRRQAPPTSRSRWTLSRPGRGGGGRTR